jgi:serine-type D-Ala-D-Ala carboxypeptidase/endopeptidase (penicillin-binding protein 4)
MLELLGSGLISLWLDMAGVQVKPLDALDTLAWQSGPSLVLAPDPNPAVATTVQEYLKTLGVHKLVPPDKESVQGIWIQSGPMLMTNHQGTTPLPAASLTKIATSLASIKTFGLEHQFETLVSATGPIKNGVLEGDLIIEAKGDPLFVSEEAITLGNTLNQMGIKQVKGNLIINGPFALNFQRHPLLAGQLLKDALNASKWNRQLSYAYNLMPKKTPKPQVVVNGKVKLEETLPTEKTLLVRHHSLPLKQLIKEMNVFSNNDMAQMLAEAVGGHEVVQTTAASLARVPQSEIQLINGSGLGPENQISPRAATAMLMAIQRLVAPHNLTVADLFPTAGYDHRGTLHSRHMPKATTMKTGTLRDVSALAGVFPTRDRGLVWFTIINRGPDVSSFRVEQDKLLQSITKKLLEPTDIPNLVIPHGGTATIPDFGAVRRNEVIYKG